mmetsp:Transcript_13564/g.20485  ORF Transcript_13564/g.20485 Transcript_13564/m.20485 type:complete len:262 (-) Transcript_13564:34-819(-)
MVSSLWTTIDAATTGRRMHRKGIPLTCRRIRGKAIPSTTLPRAWRWRRWKSMSSRAIIKHFLRMCWWMSVQASTPPSILVRSRGHLFREWDGAPWKKSFMPMTITRGYDHERRCSQRGLGPTRYQRSMTFQNGSTFRCWRMRRIHLQCTAARPLESLRSFWDAACFLPSRMLWWQHEEAERRKGCRVLMIMRLVITLSFVCQRLANAFGWRAATRFHQSASVLWEGWHLPFSRREVSRLKHYEQSCRLLYAHVSNSGLECT